LKFRCTNFEFKVSQFYDQLKKSDFLPDPKSGPN